MPEEIWRFTYMGERTHFLFASADCIARCGVSVIVSSEWRGTGSQEEYELAASMPKCATCLRLIAKKPTPKPPKKPAPGRDAKTGKFYAISIQDSTL